MKDYLINENQPKPQFPREPDRPTIRPEPHPKPEGSPGKRDSPPDIYGKPVPDRPPSSDPNKK